MEKPTIILATSNSVGMGHLARASAIALALKEYANLIIVSMASGIAGTSEQYESCRAQIAEAAYGEHVEVIKKK